jgi:glycosyltransferase involved in cell wall biosynthesis
MYKGKSVAVVVPAHNEEKLIGRVIETTPGYVDHIVVVDDLSGDRTAKIVEEYQSRDDDRVVLIRTEKNLGVGGAIAEGYKWCRDHKIQATAVMAGDAQMDPSDLPALLEPVVKGEVDYTKGNRLFTGEAWNTIPKTRYMGNAVLSLLTKIASGYWHVADSQTGYTVANQKVLSTIDLDKIYKRYGMPNDLLVKLNIYDFKVRDVEIQPIYGIGEKSGIKPLLVIPRFSWLLTRLFFYRMFQKYIIRDFHPLVFFYILSFFLNLLGFGLSIRLLIIWIDVGVIPPINSLAVFFSYIVGIQMLLFAMWFDMDSNKHLR